MSIEILVPAMGESVIEATVSRWLVEAGAAVKAGQPLVALETDKVDLEVAAPRDGVLAEILVQAGADVKIGDVLGRLEAGAQAESAEALPRPMEATVEPESEAKATPVARRMAADAGVDVARIAGSGSGGRVTKEDVEKALSAKTAPLTTTAPSPVLPSSLSSLPPVLPSSLPLSPFTRPDSHREERVKLSRRRRTIAQRLVEAQHNAAMLTTFNEVDMSAVMDLRKRRRDAFEKQYGVRLGFMSFFTKAAIGGLKAFPRLNAEIDGDEMILKHYYDIGIAVGAEEGLVVPVLRDADRLSFAQIEQSIRDLAQKSQDGTLALADLQGGSFTITNGGVFGSLLSTPILNAPQVGILGLHKIEERPVVIDGAIVARPMMYLALSYDHRIVDGREAVQFLVKVKELIEDPERLLLEM